MGTLGSYLCNACINLKLVQDKNASLCFKPVSLLGHPLSLAALRVQLVRSALCAFARLVSPCPHPDRRQGLVVWGTGERNKAPFFPFTEEGPGAQRR